MNNTEIHGTFFLHRVKQNTIFITRGFPKLFLKVYCDMPIFISNKVFTQKTLFHMTEICDNQDFCYAFYGRTTPRTPSTFCSFIMIHLWCIIFISMTYLFHYNLNVIYGIAYSKFGNWKICNIILLLCSYMYMYNSQTLKVQTDSMLHLKVRKDTHSYIICYHFIIDAYVNFTLLTNKQK